MTQPWQTTIRSTASVLGDADQKREATASAPSVACGSTSGPVQSSAHPTAASDTTRVSRTLPAGVQSFSPPNQQQVKLSPLDLIGRFATDLIHSVSHSPSVS